MDLRANIVEKRGTLQVVITYKDVLGVSRQRWRDTKLKKKGNKKRAEKIKDAFLLEVEQELLEKEREPKNRFEWEKKVEITFFDFLKDSLKIAKQNISELTYISYEKCVETRIKDFFKASQLPLTELRPIHLQKFYQSILDDGCTANTAIHYHAYIRKALQHAVNMDYIPNNVADRVDKPRKKQFIPQFYSSAEVEELLDAVQGEKVRLVILMTAFYGLRRSEVLGLKWSALDFVNKKFKINHVVLENPYNYGVLIKKDQTKNDPSYRSMPLVEEIERELVQQAKWQQENRELFGDQYKEEDSEYIFTMEDGRLMTPSYISKRTKKLMRKNHLRVIRFHDLRHSNASIMLDNGQDMKRIQEWLGHASFSTTANLYAHLTPGFKNEAASSLEKVFGFDKKDTKKEPHSSKK
ncbi:tyrosine-type recombinase/integrase [Enterococcus lactis]|uniref:tyrosine-type recombinase/integrase n=1 Tax=Enterococcus lactis TaxID=357441 RepID=UPI00237ACC47|nr:tyrosine-type recombinase/integrase [Enterococcus lactis]